MKISPWKLVGYMVVIITLIWSGISPKDYFTWFLEVLPVMIGLPLLFYFNKKSLLSDLFFAIVIIHCLVLCLGGRYTYAEVPLGFWLQDVFGFSRNHYDRIGHFMQGVTPAFLTYEVFLRKRLMNYGGWLFLVSVAMALSFSAFYELIEWWTAALTGEAAEAFLGTQGDVWDTQWDMFLAMNGAIIIGLVIKFSGYHKKLGS